MSQHADYPQGMAQGPTQAYQLQQDAKQKAYNSAAEEIVITSDELYGNAKSHIESLQDEIDKTRMRLTELQLKQRMFVAQVEAYNASQAEAPAPNTYDGTPQLARSGR